MNNVLSEQEMEEFKNSVGIMNNASADDSKRIKGKIKAEKILLKNLLCKKEAISKIQEKYYEINYHLLSDALDGLPLIDYQIYHNMKCVNEYITPKELENNNSDSEISDTDKTDTDKIDKIINMYRIKNWLKNEKYIGSGAYGYTMSVSLKDGANNFIIKSSSDSKDDTIIHEAIVGLLVTNNLKKLIPTFSFIYGYFECSPLVFRDEKILTWCKAPKPKNKYLIMENITNSVSVSIFIYGDKNNPPCTALEFLLFFLQIINALNLAYKTNGYTHYDLHTDNILVRRNDNEISMPFFYNDEIKWINTNVTAHIIDYGFSHIKIEDYHFGIMRLEKYNIFHDKSFPMYDIYKILYMSMYNAYRSDNDDVYNLVNNMLKFFPYMNYEKIYDQKIEIQNKEVHNTFIRKSNLDVKFIKTTYDKYINWLFKTYDINDVLTDEPEYDRSDKLSNTNINIFNNNAVPDNIFDYCELIVYTKKYNADNLDMVLSKIPFDNSLYYNYVDEYIDKAVLYGLNINNIKLTELSNENIYDLNIIENYENNLVKLLSFGENKYKLDVWCQCIIYAMKINRINIPDKLEYLLTEINIFNEKYSELSSTVHENAKFIHKLNFKAYKNEKFDNFLKEKMGKYYKFINDTHNNYYYAL